MVAGVYSPGGPAAAASGQPPRGPKTFTVQRWTTSAPVTSTIASRPGRKEQVRCRSRRSAGLSALVELGDDLLDLGPRGVDAAAADADELRGAGPDRPAGRCPPCHLPARPGSPRARSAPRCTRLALLGLVSGRFGHGPSTSSTRLRTAVDEGGHHRVAWRQFAGTARSMSVEVRVMLNPAPASGRGRGPCGASTESTCLAACRASAGERRQPLATGAQGRRVLGQRKRVDAPLRSARRRASPGRATSTPPAATGGPAPERPGAAASPASADRRVSLAARRSATRRRSAAAAGGGCVPDGGPQPRARLEVAGMRR